MPDEPPVTTNNKVQRAEYVAKRVGSIPTQVFTNMLQGAVNHTATTITVDPAAATRPWRNLGPRNIGGRIRSLVQDPNDPATLYAGSASGGVWKTTDGGDTWAVQDDFRPPNAPNNVAQALPVGAMAVAYQGLTVGQPAVVYVGTGEPTFGYLPGKGLFWSTNGGQSYNRLLAGTSGVFQAQNYERILVDPWNPRRLWAVSPSLGLVRGVPAPAPATHAFTDDSAAGIGLPAGVGITDIAIVFGNPRGGQPATYVVLVGVAGRGLFQATYTVASESYTTNFAQVPIPGLPASFNRVKVAFCQAQPNRRYVGVQPTAPAAINGRMQVFSNVNMAGTWSAIAAQPPWQSNIAWYAMVLEVDPRNPRVVFAGQMNLYRSTNAGAGWTGVITNAIFNTGNLEGHPDIHSVVFDAVVPRRLWVGNDGGVTLSHDLGTTWRRRSHGIYATQFVDITSHPTYPHMYGGGLQDNGSWITFAGNQTWVRVGHSDGGALGFEPGNPRLFDVTTQAGSWRGQIATNFGANTHASLTTPTPDIALAVNASGNMTSHKRWVNGAIPAGHGPVFYGILVHHPTANNRALLGRFREAYFTSNGTTFASMGLPAFQLHGGTGTPEVSALAYGANPNRDFWVGTSHGDLFRSTDGGANWQGVEPVAARGNWISAIATHPSNNNICAIAIAANPGRVYITGDRGTTWVEFSGNSGAPTATAAANRLPNAGITALTFDRSSPNAPGSAQTLYAGSLTGVFVIRNALAPTAGFANPFFAPAWRSFNNGLPLSFIFDMETVRYTDAGGTTHNLLRAGTFGRGIYECELGIAPSVRLLIRNNIADSGVQLAAANRLPDEPRLAAGTALVNHQSTDIRIDSTLTQFVGQRLDAVEFDEQLRSDSLGLGTPNQVFVKVQNMGATASATAQISLYFATASNATTAPNLPGNFWTGFPQASAGPWTLIQTQTVSGLASAAPQVVRFLWNVPAAAGANVALLALVTDPAADNLTAVPLPATNINTLISAERRAALYITPTRAGAARPIVRDANDQLSRLGSTPWALSSNDILVKRGAVVANPNVTFADISARHVGDNIDAGNVHRIYVRVHNQGGQAIAATDISVDVFAFTPQTMIQPDNWQRIGSGNVPAIAANATGFAAPIVWNAAGTAGQPPDPNAAGQPKYYLLAAIVTPRGQDVLPSLQASITDIASFWRYFEQRTLAHNAAVRYLPWVP